MIEKFFKILAIEFEDLEESIIILIKSILERLENHEITNYVMKENNSLLKREHTDILQIHKEIMKMNMEDYQSVEDASTAVISLIYSFKGIPEAVHIYMEGRVKKVVRYMKEVS